MIKSTIQHFESKVTSKQDINISFSIELGKMCILIQVERKNIEKLFEYEFLKS